jgi:hypothetical protein
MWPRGTEHRPIKIKDVQFRFVVGINVTAEHKEGYVIHQRLATIAFSSKKVQAVGNPIKDSTHVGLSTSREASSGKGDTA